MVTFTVNDFDTRLMLFDFTIPFGLHRIYNTVIILNFEIFGLIIFKYYHLVIDKKIMFWTEIVDIFRQKYSRWTIPFKLLLTDLPKSFKLAEMFTKLTMLINIVFLIIYLQLIINLFFQNCSLQVW